MKYLPATCLVAALVLATGVASADAGPDPSGLWLMPGLNVADGIHDGTDGVVAGFEASVVYNKRQRWLGGYVDILYDYERESGRTSFGPEIGLGPLGIDAGMVLELDHGSRKGIVVRPLLSLGIIALVGRVGYFPGSQHEAYGELGLLLKAPIELGRASEE
jgi:hypothetical protein